jgi:subfamily B ATP-binding cassette protein MsbA
MYNKISYLPLAFFSDEKKGDIIARMSADVLEVEWSILTTLEKIIRDPLIIIGSIGFMLLVSPRLTLFVAIMLVLTGLIIGGISKQLKKQSGEVQSTLGKILVMVEETLGGLKVVKAFNAEKMVNSRFAKENNHYRQMYTKLLWRRDLASPLSEFLGIVAVCVLFVYGAKLVMNSQMGSEVFMAFLLAFFYTINPAKSISSAYYNFQKGSAAMDRINMILKEKNPIREISGEASLNTFKDKIEFKDVNFSYNTNTPLVLKNISFDVNKNKTIALVGASGSGKSTIASLLLRLYDVSEGKIKIDGLEIDQIKLDELRQLFGLVTQDPILFNTTIAENISFGTGITDMKRIADAARIANAHEFIEQMPEGYETMAGDSGQKLSGGQKQRIALARAILADPPILILDEATSALDSRSESLVQDALEKILKDRTAIVIAHRLSTIQRSDKILVLRDGEIIEEGKHEELLSRRGEYSKFVELQRM